MERPTRAPGDSPEQRRDRAQRIRWAREIMAPNRLEFARKLGVDITTLRDIESGKTNPGLVLAWRLFHALHISLDYVVAGRLVGVAPDLAAALLEDHPELRPPRPQGQAVPTSDNPGIDPRPSTDESSPVFYLAR